MTRYQIFKITFFLIATGFSSCGIFHSSKLDKKENEEKGEMLEGMQFFSVSRSFPATDVDPGSFGKAYDFYKTNYVNSTMRSSGLWENIGPTNVGGRTLCVTIDPNDTSIVWLGSASGGLWKSTTGGLGANAWTYVETGYPVLGVSSIAIDPTNSNIMYIGTGETYNYGTSLNGIAVRTTRGTHGMGILKSTDGGITWNYSLNWTYQSQRGIWEILINPLNTNVLYAATTEGIYKSTDAGSTWNNVLNLQMVMDIEMDKVDTNIVYAGVGNFGTIGAGLYKTTNSGSTWNILTSGLPTGNTGRISISAYPGNNKVLVATICDMFNTLGVYKSLNEGASWITIDNVTEIHSYQGWYCNGLVFHPTDSCRLLASGVELYECDSAGTNFEMIGGSSSLVGNYIHPDFHGIVLNPLDPNKVYLATDGGLFRSNNFGKNAFECTSGYVTTQFYIGSVSSYNANLALGGLQDNGTVLYDGNPAWYWVNGGDGCFNAIDPYNDYNMYASWQGLHIDKSTDQGFSFNSCFAPTGGAAFVAPFVMCPGVPDVLYGGSRYMSRSDDAGSSWNTVGPNPLSGGSYILSIAVSGVSCDTLYCGLEPYSSVPMKILKSENGGYVYTDVTGSLPDRYPRDIVVNPHNSNEVYVVFSGFGTGHIFKSTDGGGSWTDISTTLPDVPFHCMAVNPDNVNMIFAGSDLGVFSSMDKGLTWSSFATGMPMAAMVFDLVISPADTTIMAYTHGNGVYKRKMEDAVGVNEAGILANPVTVFPNPAVSELTVTGKEITAVSVYAFNGQKLVTVTALNNEVVKLDVGKIPTGIYILQVKTGKGMHQEKLIISR